LENLCDVPRDSAIRFEPGLQQLADALERAEHMSEDEYKKMRSAAASGVVRTDWKTAALSTIDAYLAAAGTKRAIAQPSDDSPRHIRSGPTRPISTTERT